MWDYKRWDRLSLDTEDDEALAILQAAKRQADASFQNSTFDDDLPNFYDELSRRFFTFSLYSDEKRQSVEGKEAFQLGISCTLNSIALRLQLKQFKNVIDISELLISLLIENSEENIDMPLFRTRYFRSFARLQLVDAAISGDITRDVLELHASKRRIVIPNSSSGTPSSLRTEFDVMMATLLREIKRKKVPLSLNVIVNSAILTNEELLHFTFMIVISESDTKEDARKLCQSLEHILEWDAIHSFLAHYVQGEVCGWMGNHVEAAREYFKSAVSLHSSMVSQGSRWERFALCTVLLHYRVALSTVSVTKHQIRLAELRLGERALAEIDKILSRWSDSTDRNLKAPSNVEVSIISISQEAIGKVSVDSSSNYSSSSSSSEPEGGGGGTEHLFIFKEPSYYINKAIDRIIAQHPWCSLSSSDSGLFHQIDSLAIQLKMHKFLHHMRHDLSESSEAEEATEGSRDEEEEENSDSDSDSDSESDSELKLIKEDDKEEERRQGIGLDELLSHIMSWAQRLVQLSSALDVICKKKQTIELREGELRVLDLLDKICELFVQRGGWEEAKLVAGSLIDTATTLLQTTSFDESIPLSEQHNHQFIEACLTKRALAQIAVGQIVLQQFRIEHNILPDQVTVLDETVVDEASQVWERAGSDSQAAGDRLGAYTAFHRAAELLGSFVGIEPFLHCLDSRFKHSDVHSYIAERAHDLHRLAAKNAFQIAEALEVELTVRSKISLDAGTSIDSHCKGILNRLFELYQKSIESMYHAGLCMLVVDEEKAALALEACKSAQPSYRRMMTLHDSFATSEATSAFDHSGYHIACGDVSYHLSCAYLRRGKLLYAYEEARQCLAHYRREEDRGYATDKIRRLKGLEVLALCSHAIGRPDEAEQALTDMRFLEIGPYPNSLSSGTFVRD